MKSKWKSTGGGQRKRRTKEIIETDHLFFLGFLAFLLPDSTLEITVGDITSVFGDVTSNVVSLATDGASHAETLATRITVSIAQINFSRRQHKSPLQTSI